MKDLPMKSSSFRSFAIVLTLFACLLMPAVSFAQMKPEQQAKFQAAAEKAIDDTTTKFNAQEKDVIEFFKKEGKKVYEPDQNAFRTYAQQKYLEQYGKDWPKDALERINAIR